MTDKPRLSAIGISKPSGKGFEIKSELDKTAPAPPTSDPHVGPHLIHNGSVTCCSECGHPVNIPTGTCGACQNCPAQFGGCG